MKAYTQLFALLTTCTVLSSVTARPYPDGSETHPVPGPGLAYGGIPYGSMTGNVAEYFRTAAPPGLHSANLNVNYAPIEQYLR